MRSIKVLAGIVLGVVVSAMLFGGSRAFAVETPYSIIYDSGVVTDMPTDVDSKTLNDTVQISSSKPKRDEVFFHGWCNTLPTNVDGNDVCSGTTYAIGSDWSINPTSITNNLRLYAMWGDYVPEPQPSTAGCISYHANAPDAVGTMGCQSQTYIESTDSYDDVTDGGSVTLLASNYSRTGYGFAGWSDSYDYATNPNAKFYGPQEKITVPNGTVASGLSLYAVWIKSEGNLQDQSKVASVCDRLTQAPIDGTANLSSVSALTDLRDNETYAIAKLADGKCWMIENLRLENTAEHNSDGTLAQGYGVSTTYGNFSGLAEPEAEGVFKNYDSGVVPPANSLYYSGTQEGTASIDIGTSNSPDCRMPRYNNSNTPVDPTERPQNPTSNDAVNSSSNAGMYSYGNYYTWAAAVADLSLFTGNNMSVTETSLCPTGWRLPKGGNKSRITNYGDNEYWNLVVNGLNEGVKPINYDSGFPFYNGATAEAEPIANKLNSYPNNFLYAGGIREEAVYGRGQGNFYWTSTYYSVGTTSDLAYGLHVVWPSVAYGVMGVIPADNYTYRSTGRSIRCMTDL